MPACEPQPSTVRRFAVGAEHISATVYLASTLYHLWPSEGRWKVRLERLDNAAIFLFIAGTYTPLAALGLDPELGNGQG